MIAPALVIDGARPADGTAPVTVSVTTTGLTMGRADSAVETLDAGGLILAPGYIDTQVNGGFGNDFTEEPHTIWTVGARLPEHGVTGFLPTVITSQPGRIEAALEVLREGPPSGYRGARVLGLHIEGPMISPQRRGTHPEQYLRPIDRDAIHSWIDGNVAMFTLAPELPGALDAIADLTSRGVTVSMGHSAATIAEARAGFAAGASHGTHLFNAMPPVDHREPGLAGFILTSDRATASMIVDGIHASPEMVNLVWKAMGRDRLVLITDAMAGMGMPHGEYQIGQVVVSVDSSGARNPDGALAGSTLTMDEAVRNLARFTGCSPDDAIATATTTPRAVLGMRTPLPNPSDLILIDDGLGVAATIVGGRILHRA